MPLRSIKAITFDFTHTLALLHSSYGKIFAYALNQIGMTADPADLNYRYHEAVKAYNCTFEVAYMMEQVHTPIYREMVHAIFRNVCSDTVLPKVLESIWITLGEKTFWKIKPYVQETLQLLKAQGYKLYIVSNWDSRLRKLIPELGWADLFDGMHLGGELDSDKSQITFFHTIQASLQLHTSQIVHIGSNFLEDYINPKKAGWQAIWLRKSNSPILKQYTSYKSIEHIGEVLPLLSGAKGSSVVGLHHKLKQFAFEQIPVVETAPFLLNNKISSLRQWIQYLFETFKLNEERIEQVLMEHWKQIVGSTFAHRCVPQKILDGRILIIRTANPIIRQELHFQTNNILKKIRELPKGNTINQIIFSTD